MRPTRRRGISYARLILSLAGFIVFALFVNVPVTALGATPVLVANVDFGFLRRLAIAGAMAGFGLALGVAEGATQVELVVGGLLLALLLGICLLISELAHAWYTFARRER